MSSAVPDKTPGKQTSDLSPTKDRLFTAAILAPLPLWFIWLGISDRPLDLLWPIAQPFHFVSLVLIYPVLEEIVFRGLVQESLQRMFKSRNLGPVSLANIVTSILFTAVHFFFHAPLWAAAVFIPSLVFGYFKDRHGQLISPILLHSFYNCGYFWLFGGPA